MAPKNTSRSTCLGGRLYLAAPVGSATVSPKQKRVSPSSFAQGILLFLHGLLFRTKMLYASWKGDRPVPTHTHAVEQLRDKQGV